MDSEISAQNWGTRAFSCSSAYCWRNGSGSERRARTPAADVWERGAIVVQLVGVVLVAVAVVVEVVLLVVDVQLTRPLQLCVPTPLATK